MRPLAALIFLLVGCSPAAPQVNTATVDINAAAIEAQDSIDSYAATVAATSTPPLATRAPVPRQRSAMVSASTGDLQPPDPLAPGTPGALGLGGLGNERTPTSEAPPAP